VPEERVDAFEAAGKKPGRDALEKQNALLEK
jgi:hypothetical protein